MWTKKLGFRISIGVGLPVAETSPVADSLAAVLIANAANATKTKRATTSLRLGPGCLIKVLMRANSSSMQKN
jgi:hypothetical protein